MYYISWEYMPKISVSFYVNILNKCKNSTALKISANILIQFKRQYKKFINVVDDLNSLFKCWLSNY